jgi:hypothetical protein
MHYHFSSYKYKPITVTDSCEDAKESLIYENNYNENLIGNDMCVT